MLITPPIREALFVCLEITGWGKPQPLWLGYIHASMAATLTLRVLLTAQPYLCKHNCGIRLGAYSPSEVVFTLLLMIMQKKSLAKARLFFKCVSRLLAGVQRDYRRSAIWTALRAAPLRIWSPTIQMFMPLSQARSLRIRPT